MSDKNVNHKVIYLIGKKQQQQQKKKTRGKKLVIFVDVVNGWPLMNITLLPYLPLAYFCTTPFGTCSSLYITLYFVVVCTFAFTS